MIAECRPASSPQKSLGEDIFSCRHRTKKYVAGFYHNHFKNSFSVTDFAIIEIFPIVAVHTTMINPTEIIKNKIYTPSGLESTKELKNIRTVQRMESSGICV